MLPINEYYLTGTEILKFICGNAYISHGEKEKYIFLFICTEFRVRVEVLAEQDQKQISLVPTLVRHL